MTNPPPLQSVANMASEQIKLAAKAAQQNNTEAALNRLTQTSVLLDRMRTIILDNLEPCQN